MKDHLDAPPRFTLAVVIAVDITNGANPAIFKATTN
jgi:hypothetical protein